jgi:hypothetical protein
VCSGSTAADGTRGCSSGVGRYITLTPDAALCAPTALERREQFFKNCVRLSCFVLFVLGSFNDAFDRLDYTDWNERVISE